MNFHQFTLFTFRQNSLALIYFLFIYSYQMFHYLYFFKLSRYSTAYGIFAKENILAHDTRI